jgi:hypothetical protein
MCGGFGGWGGGGGGGGEFEKDEVTEGGCSSHDEMLHDFHSS